MGELTLTVYMSPQIMNVIGLIFFAFLVKSLIEFIP